MVRLLARSTLFPYTTLFRSLAVHCEEAVDHADVRLHSLGQRDQVAVHRLHRAERSEEHTSELQSQFHLVCRLLLEKKNHTANNCQVRARGNGRPGSYVPSLG